jgi:hypothetical protein
VAFSAACGSSSNPASPGSTSSIADRITFTQSGYVLLVTSQNTPPSVVCTTPSALLQPVLVGATEAPVDVTHEPPDWVARSTTGNGSIELRFHDTGTTAIMWITTIEGTVTGSGHDSLNPSITIAFQGADDGSPNAINAVAILANPPGSPPPAPGSSFPRITGTLQGQVQFGRDQESLACNSAVWSLLPRSDASLASHGRRR